MSKCFIGLASVIAWIPVDNLRALQVQSFNSIAILIFRAKREFDVKKAEYDTDVNTAKAEADLAFDLQVTVANNLLRSSYSITRKNWSLAYSLNFKLTKNS